MDFCCCFFLNFGTGCDLGRLRKPLEKFRPPSTTELLLSNDGDHLLEGCITNFFVVCRRVRIIFFDFSLVLCSKPNHVCGYDVHCLSITTEILLVVYLLDSKNIYLHLEVFSFFFLTV